MSAACAAGSVSQVMYIQRKGVRSRPFLPRRHSSDADQFAT